MTTIHLTGLKANSPLGFLAALGLLRLCTNHLKLDCRLSWQDPADPSATEAFWHATLELPGTLLRREELHERLLLVLRSRSGAAEFLQSERHRYKLTCLRENQEFLRKVLLSASFLIGLLEQFPHLISADMLTTENRFELATVIALATADMSDAKRQDFCDNFFRKADNKLRKVLTPLNEFYDLPCDIKIKKLKNKNFLRAVTERFPDLNDVDSFFTDSRTANFFAVVEGGCSPTPVKRRTKTAREQVREKLQQVLADRTEMAGDEAEDGGNRYYFAEDGIFAGIPDPFVPISVFRSWAEPTLDNWVTDDQHRFLSFLAAYRAPVTIKGREIRSALIMQSGQQRLFECTLAIPEKCCLNNIKEVLYGPWTRDDDGSPLGLDPDVIQSHATSAMDPSTAGQNRNALAVWLAVEALPLFPVIPVAHNAGHTPAFDSKGRVFVWPVWKAPLSLQAIIDLFSHVSARFSKVGETVNRARKFERELGERGIAVLFESNKKRNGKYDTLLSAKRIF